MTDDPEFRRLAEEVANRQRLEQEKWAESEEAQAVLFRLERAAPDADEARLAGTKATEALNSWIRSRRALEEAVASMLGYARAKVGL